MDFNDLLRQQTADLAVLFQDTFTAITHQKASTEGKRHAEVSNEVSVGLHQSPVSKPGSRQVTYQKSYLMCLNFQMVGVI